jgi:hypothetical protein
MRCVQVSCLAGVHHRSAAYRHIAVEPALGCESRRLLERRVGGLDRHIAVDRRFDTCRVERFAYGAHVLAGGKPRIGEQGDARQSQLAGVLAGFAKDARTKRERRHPDGEASVAAFDGGEIGMATGHVRLLRPG